MSPLVTAAIGALTTISTVGGFLVEARLPGKCETGG